MSTNHEEEIQYRQFLMNELAKGNGKQEYVEWLNTHSIYHYDLGSPFYLNVIETLEKKQWYSLKIEIESLNYKDSISPVISIPFGEGQIVAPFEVRNRYGKKSSRKPIKMLVFEKELSKSTSVKFQAELGLLSVQYYCSHYDPTVKLQRLSLSSHEHTTFAIRREPINDHAVRYFCKSPVSDSFDALVFTIEWTKIDESLTDKL